MAVKIVPKDNIAGDDGDGTSPHGQDHRVPNWEPVLLLLLVAAGFWLRVRGITFGLPFNYHFDENLYADTARTFSLESPHPTLGPFQLLLAGESRLLPLLKTLPADPRLAATLDSSKMSFHLLARWTSAFFGAISLIPMYLLGREVWGRTVGVLSAVFLCFMYLHVRSSHFGVPDTVVTFFVIAAAYACVRLAATGAWRYYCLAGLMTGLAIPTKQLTWPLLVVILLFHLEGTLGAGSGSPARRLLASVWNGKLIAAYAIATVTLILTSPQLILAWKPYYSYWRLGLALGAKGGLGRLALDPGPRWWFYLGSLRWGMGEAMLWLAVAGSILVIIRRRPRGAFLLMSYPALFFLFLCRPGNFYFARYAMTATPFMILAGAGLLATVLDRVRAGERTRAVLVSLCALAVVAQPAVASLRLNALLVRKDTRTQAKEWIEANIPAGSRITLEAWVFGPQLASPGRVPRLSKRLYEVSTKGIYGLSQPNGSEAEYSGSLTVEDYEREGVQYIVSNSFTSDSHLLDPTEDRAKRAFYAELREKAQLVKEFSPFLGRPPAESIFDENYGPALDLTDRARPGPVIRIYRLSGSPPDSRRL